MLSVVLGLFIIIITLSVVGALAWKLYNRCPKACSGSGECFGGVCRCHVGYSGVDCAACDTGYVPDLASKLPGLVCVERCPVANFRLGSTGLPTSPCNAKARGGECSKDTGLCQCVAPGTQTAGCGISAALQTKLDHMYEAHRDAAQCPNLAEYPQKTVENFYSQWAKGGFKTEGPERYGKIWKKVCNCELGVNHECDTASGPVVPPPEEPVVPAPDAPVPPKACGEGHYQVGKQIKLPKSTCNSAMKAGTCDDVTGQCVCAAALGDKVDRATNCGFSKEMQKRVDKFYTDNKKAFKSATNHPSDKVATAENFLRKWTDSGFDETEAVMNRDLQAASQCSWDNFRSKMCV